MSHSPKAVQWDLSVMPSSYKLPDAASVPSPWPSRETGNAEGSSGSGREVPQTLHHICSSKGKS